MVRPWSDSIFKPIGGAMVFTCEARGAVNNADYDIKWFDNQHREIVEPPGSRRYVEVDSPSITRLYITQILQSDAGNYTCSATINGRQQQKTVALHIFQEITFDDAPSPQHPTIYSDALIKCRVSGQPRPTVSWRYDGRRISNGGRYQLESNGLRIVNITTADNGQYTCRAEVESWGLYDERHIIVEVDYASEGRKMKKMYSPLKLMRGAFPSLF